MKKMLIMLLMVIILVIQVTAWQEVVSSTTIDFKMTSGINEVNNGDVSNIIAKVLFSPQLSKNQEVIFLTSNLDYTIEEDRILKFLLNKNNYVFEINSEITSSRSLVEIREKVVYPLKNYSPEVEDYLGEVDNIVITPEIKKKAQEIAKGKDDLYEIVFDIGVWINENIDYDFSAINSGTVDSTDDVFVNKKGVCDEFTSLHIAMLRSIGIPARFVSGIAYTNMEEFDTPWTGHAWTEVFFPDYGWTDWDVTYGQMGYIDATHYKFHDSSSAVVSAVKYSWNGNGNVKIQTVDYDTKLKNKGTEKKLDISLSAEPSYDTVTFGSYNMVDVTIKNNENFYVAMPISISKSQELEYESGLHKYVLLKPKETKHVYWLMFVPQLNKEYIYTFPLSIYTMQNHTTETEFKVSSKSITVPKESLQSLMLVEKTSDTDVFIDCKTEKKFYYDYETPTITCEFTNLENSKEITTCIEDVCEKVKLRKEETHLMMHNPEHLNSGVNTFVVSAQGAQKKIMNFNVLSLDVPKASITADIPETISYEDQINFSINIKKLSRSIIYEPEVLIKVGSVKKTINLNTISDSQQIVLSLSGKMLDVGQNLIPITIKYYDGNNRTYVDAKNLEIKLINVTILQRTTIMLRNLGEFIAGLLK